MNIQQIQSNYQTPKFKGLYKYDLFKVKPNLREGIDEVLAFSKGAKMGSIDSDECLGVLQRDNNYVMEMLQRSKINFEYKYVGDDEILNTSILDLLKKHFVPDKKLNEVKGS